MDMAQLSNTLLQIFYIMIGLYMGLTMVFTIKDKNHKTRIGTALFWGILSAVFMFGDYIPSQIVGALVIVIAVLSATKQINIGTLKQLDETFATLKAEKLGLKGTQLEESIDLKLEPDLIEILQQSEGYLPAYHMNKQHWISVQLKKVAPEQILKLLEMSYKFTK